MKAGFVLSASADSLKRKDIIKVQHNCKATGFWVKKSKEYNFLLIMHEHVFVFQESSAVEQFICNSCLLYNGIRFNKGGVEIEKL